MAEALGLVASIIAVVELSAKVGNLCFEYTKSVKDARADIDRLRGQLSDLGKALQGAQNLLSGPGGEDLVTSRKLLESVDGCKSELDEVQSKLDLGRSRKTMRRFGIRALKWPFNRKETDDIIATLGRHERSINLSLQVDQTTLLLDIRQTQRAQHIPIRPKENIQSTDKPCFTVPFEPDPDFVDRPDILQWLEAQYESLSPRAALVGMGGFGKSQIAIRFAHHIRNSSPETNIFWVNASTESKLREAYRSIADRLDLPERNDSAIDILSLVRDWLQRDNIGRWLMILDNADNVKLFYPPQEDPVAHSPSQPSPATSPPTPFQRPLASFIPKGQNGKIVVTSRSIDAAERLTGSHKAIFKISVMEQTQALQLLENKLKEPCEEDAGADLIKVLGYVPLAISQAAAYINRRAPRISVRKYTEDFLKSDKTRGSLLNQDSGDLRRDESVSNSVVKTWQVTFDQIRTEKPSAANLLSFMSFFSPQGIPEWALYGYNRDDPEKNSTGLDSDFKGDLKRKYRDYDFDVGLDTYEHTEDDMASLEDDLHVLNGYSLVSFTAEDYVCEMHPLVQFCTQTWLSSFADVERWKRVFLWEMSRRFPWGGVFEDWPTCRLLVPHLGPIISQEPADGDDLLVWAELITAYAKYTEKTGFYVVAEGFQQRVYDICERLLGRDHLRTTSAISDLSWTLFLQNRWTEAEKLSLRVLEIRKRVLGDEAPDTLRTMSDLASAYYKQRRWQEAEELDLQVLNIRKRLLGEDDPETLQSMGNLAQSYWRQGRAAQAEEMQLRVLEVRKRVLGESHPSTLRIMNSLAATYANQNRLEEEEELDRQVLKVRIKVLGEAHPSTLKSMHNLALNCRDQGRREEEEKLLRQVLDIRMKVLGDEHHSTIKALEDLARNCKKQGRREEAKALTEQLSGIKKRLQERASS